MQALQSTPYLRALTLISNIGSGVRGKVGRSSIAYWQELLRKEEGRITDPQEQGVVRDAYLTMVKGLRSEGLGVPVPTPSPKRRRVRGVQLL